MATNYQNPPLASDLRSLLSGLRWRIRAYVWLDGLLLAAAWLGLTFWAGLALDYLPVLVGASEMPRGARAVLLACIAAVLALIIYHWVFRRTWIRLGDRSMALLLERRFGSFHDSLVTAVELSGQAPLVARYNPAMLARTHQEALSHSAQVRLARVFNYSPLLTKFSAALVVWAPVALFYAISSDALQLGFQRLYLLTDEPWPRRAHIEVMGIEVARPVSLTAAGEAARFVPFRKQTVKVAKGASVLLRVQADAGEHVVPDVCTVYYRTEQQERGRVQMSKIGRTRAGYQQYTFDGKPLRGILSSLQFDVVGYDHRVRDYRIEVVENPTVVETTLDCVFPEYLVDRDFSLWLPREGVDWTPGTQLPRGTQVTIHARSNKPLRRVHIQDMAAGDITTIEMPSQGDRQSFQFHLPSLKENLTLEITLHDTDDVVSQRPHRVFIAAIEDEPPQVDVVLHGIGQAITPDAIVPFTGRVRDDYQVEHTWFELVNDGQPQELAFDLQPAGHVQTSLDFRELRSTHDQWKLKPKDQITLTVKASDKYDLEGQANTGRGDTYPLSVVTADELLVMLERRELALRQRFEQIIQEVEQMRDSLLHLPGQAEDPIDLGAEPGEEKLDPEAQAQRARSLRLLRAQQAAMQSQKSAQEVLGIATSFDEIREELANNRVDSEDKQSRLNEQISQPLEHVGRDMFPELDEHLEALQLKVNDATAAADAAGQALRQTNAILAELEKVLERMIELESYNELIDLVRGLIEEHERVMEQTKEQRKRQILELLQ